MFKNIYTALFVGIVLGILSTMIMQTPVYGWSRNGDVLIEKISFPSKTEEWWHILGCSLEDHVAVLGRLDPVRMMCVIHGDNFAMANAGQSAFNSEPKADDFLFFNTDNQPFIMDKRYPLADSIYVKRPNTNNVIKITTSNAQSWVTVISDINSSVNRLYDGGDDEPLEVLRHSVGASGYQGLDIFTVGISANGRFLAGVARDYGVFRLDLDTFEVLMVSDETLIYPDYHVYRKRQRMAVSDSGSSIMYQKADDEFIIYDVSGFCGVTARGLTPISSSQSCESVDLTSRIQGYIPFNNYKSPVFLSDSEIVFSSHPGLGDESSIKVSDLSRGQSGMDYLALGDSFSSGEGDTERKSNGDSYYIEGTDEKDGCHVSSRSYPFILRDQWGIEGGKMRSIACSGAQVLPDYYGFSGDYNGQGDERKRKHDHNLKHIQAMSLENFTPGNVRQIDFVRKYQPKFITLTAGGNDVGFKQVLEQCAVLHIYNAFDCGYAKDGSPTQKALQSSIDSQYPIIKKFMSELRSVSPYTKVAIVGYPSFINDDRTLSYCHSNVGTLSLGERRMINDMTKRLNSVLQRVAHDTGASFVDTYDSLVGGRLCEGSEYMTGVWAAITKRATNEERFHPNSKGHERMANSIARALTYGTERPPSPSDFDPYQGIAMTIRVPLLDSGVLTEGQSTRVKLNPGFLESLSYFSVTVFSTPKQLGVFTTDLNGGISADISFEGVESGHHMLLIEGTGLDGEPLQLYQFIEIQPEGGIDWWRGVDYEHIPPVMGNSLPLGDRISTNLVSSSTQPHRIVGGIDSSVKIVSLGEFGLPGKAGVVNTNEDSSQEEDGVVDDDTNGLIKTVLWVVVIGVALSAIIIWHRRRQRAKIAAMTDGEKKRYRKKQLIIVAIVFAVVMVIDLFTFAGGNTKYYVKWIECGVKPYQASYVLGGNIEYYKKSSVWGIYRQNNEYYCTPLEAEKAGVSASPDAYTYPQLEKEGLPLPYRGKFY